MLILEGQMLSVSHKNFTDRKTGEITNNFTAQILDISANGDADVLKLKIDQSTAASWDKAKGKNIRAEVRPWAFVDDSGKLANGFALTDRKALPNVI